MSHRATVWAYGLRGLAPVARLVLMKLADCASDEGVCWPSQATIAGDCEISRQTVNKYIAILAAAGIISIQHRIGPKGQASNSYLLGVSSYVDSRVSSYVDTGCKDQLTAGCQATLTPIEPSVLEPSKEPLSVRRDAARLKADFEEWWGQAPRKIGKGGAETKYRIARKTATRDDLLAGIKRYAERRKGEDAQYTAHPSTWLHNKRWLDEPDAAVVDDGPKGPPPKPEDVWPELKGAPIH